MIKRVANQDLAVIAVLIVVSLVAPLSYIFFLETPPAVLSAGSAGEAK